jgi:hypothetical protein
MFPLFPKEQRLHPSDGQPVIDVLREQNPAERYWWRHRRNFVPANEALKQLGLVAPCWETVPLMQSWPVKTSGFVLTRAMPRAGSAWARRSLRWVSICWCRSGRTHCPMVLPQAAFWSIGAIRLGSSPQPQVPYSSGSTRCYTPPACRSLQRHNYSSRLARSINVAAPIRESSRRCAPRPAKSRTPRSRRTSLPPKAVPFQVSQNLPQASLPLEQQINTDYLRTLIERDPHCTLKQLCDWIREERGIRMSTTAMCRLVKDYNLRRRRCHRPHSYPKRSLPMARAIQFSRK